MGASSPLPTLDAIARAERFTRHRFVYDGATPVLEFTSALINNQYVNTITATNTIGANGLLSRNSGGASTSAVFVARSLFQPEARFPGFVDRVRVVSGASGGMLGAAYFVSQFRPGGFPCSRSATSMPTATKPPPAAGWRKRRPRSKACWTNSTRGTTPAASPCGFNPRG